MDQPQVESPAPRFGAGYWAGSAILVILSGLLAILRTPTRAQDAARTPAEHIGYIIGMVAGGVIALPLIALVVYGVTRLIGRPKPAASSAKIAFWILLVLVFLNFAAFVGGAANARTATAQTAFTDEQRQGLRLGPDSIRHASLGFALPSPGPTFAPSHELEQQFADQFGGKLPQDLIVWAFHDTTRGHVLFVQVIGSPGLDEKQFRDVARGMRTGATRKSKVLSESSIWDDTGREARLTTQTPNGPYFVMRCVPSVKPRTEFVVCVQTVTENPDALAAVSNGLSLRAQ